MVAALAGTLSPSGQEAGPFAPLEQASLPDERPAAAGFTTSARALAQAVAPTFTGLALERAATGLPFFLAGGLKIVYDRALYFRFRHVDLRGDA